MKNTTFSSLLFLALAIMLTACGGNAITQVTPLPTATDGEAQDVTASDTPTPAPLHTATQISTEPSATPTPLDNDLEAGQSRVIAAATDQAMRPKGYDEVAIDLGEEPVTLLFSEFYDGFDMRTGLVLSEKLIALDGKEVVMEGYVAPPLKPKVDFLVLTRIRLAFCPFCSSDADWPNDIALLYLPSEIIVDTLYPARVRGRLEVGSQIDAETGMVSLVRIYVDEFDPIQSTAGA